MIQEREIFFRLGLALLVAVPAGVRLYFHRRSLAPTSATPTPNREAALEGFRFLLFTFPLKLAFLILVVLHVANSSWIRSLVIPIPNGLRWFGLVLGTLGTVGVFEVHRRIAKSWSPALEIIEGHELVTTGPYRFVRHPSQSVRSVITIALGLISADWLLMTLCAISIGIRYYRIERTEAKLIERFGDQYRDYTMRTGCLLPHIWPRT